MIIQGIRLPRKQPERPSKTWKDCFVLIERCLFEDEKVRLVILQRMQTRISVTHRGRVWRVPQ